MGNPDMATPDYIVDKLCETARDPRAHRYSASRGIKGLRKAMSPITSAASGWTSIPTPK
jgi:alanine-synthesizing transaminase